MADPYWRYAADAASGPPPAYPSYIKPEASTLASQPLYTSHNHLGSSSDYLHNDILPSRPGAYGVDDYIGIRRSETGIGDYAAGTSRNGHPPMWDDPYPLGRRDVMQGIKLEIPDIVTERPASLRMADAPPVGIRESNVLFVDALPSDCTRREVSHLFRPFHGFQELRLVHKEPRHGEDSGLVLCFVEFIDSKHALTALDALQGYKFDIKKPDAPALKIQFAHFPFQLPPDREEQHHANSFQKPSNREDLGHVTPRREPSIDEEPRGRKKFEKRKFEGSPRTSKKAKNVESTADSSDSRKGRRHVGGYLADSKGCFSCGKLDHKSWDCPKASAKTCFNCGKLDHMKRDCPKLNINGSKRKKKGNVSEAHVKEEP